MDESGADYTEWSKPERKTPIEYTDGIAKVRHDWATKLNWTDSFVIILMAF